MRTCTHCGAVAPEGSVFCPVCGTALPLEAQPAAATAAEAGPAEASAAQPAEAAPSAEDAGAAPVTEPGPAPAAPTADAAAASSPANVPAVPAADASVGAPAPFVPADAAPAAAAPAAVPPVYGGQSFGAGYSAPQQPAANSCAAPQQPAYGGYAAPQGGAVPPVYGGQPAGAGYTAQQPAANPYAVPQQPAANPYAVPQQPAANPYAVPQQPAADDAALRSAGYGAFIAALSSQRMLILNALLSASALCTLFSLIASGKSNAGIAVGAVVYYALTLAAPWWMYLAARKTAVNGGAYDTGGLTMYKVLMTIGFIVSWVAVGIYLIILLFAGSMLPSILQSAYQEAGSYGTDLSTLSGVVGVMVVFVLLLLAGMTVLTVFMFLKLRRTLNALLCSARTGLPTAFVSQFLIVLNYIFGVFAAISAVGALFSAFSLGLPGLFTLVSCVCSTVYMFLLADGMKTYQRQCQAIWQSFGLLPYMT